MCLDNITLQSDVGPPAFPCQQRSLTMMQKSEKGESLSPFSHFCIVVRPLLAGKSACVCFCLFVVVFVYILFTFPLFIYQQKVDLTLNNYFCEENSRNCFQKGHPVEGLFILTYNELILNTVLLIITFLGLYS